MPHRQAVPNIGEVYYMTKSYIGIDVSKKNLQVFVFPEEKDNTFDNTNEGIKKLITFLNAYDVALIALEATGRLEEKCAYTLLEADYSVSMLNSDTIQSFRRILNIKAKTDHKDAKLIARYAQIYNPPPMKKLTLEEKKLYLLSTRRDELVEYRIKEKQRLSVKDDEYSVKSINNVLACVNKEIEDCEEEIMKLIKMYPQKEKIFDILNSVPGVGMLVAISMLANLPELGQLSAKKISALAGVCPINVESGTIRKFKSMKYCGRVRVRRCLYLAVLSGKRYNTFLKTIYEKEIKKGKCKKVAMGICMRKLIILLNSLVKEERNFNKEYKKQKAA